MPAPNFPQTPGPLGNQSQCSGLAFLVVLNLIIACLCASTANKSACGTSDLPLLGPRGMCNSLVVWKGQVVA